MIKKLLSVLITLAFSALSYAQVETLPPSYRAENTVKKDIYRAEVERINNLVHTKLDLKFDYEKQLVLGEAWVTLTPHFYSTKNVTLDAKSMKIHQVSLVNKNSLTVLKYTYNDFKLIIDLNKEYKKGEEYTLYIKYTAQPNEVKQEKSSAISNSKGVYFINPLGKEENKPTQIWTQGETEASSCWFPTIDQTNQKSSQEIYLTYPDKYVSLSNGLLKSSVKNSDGTKTDYWKFSKKHAPYLFFFGIGDYAIIKDKWKNIDVDYYVEPEYKDYAKQIFGHTPEMLQFFSELLDYPYPWEKYAQMTARDFVSGAMENTTASLFNESVQQKPGQLIDENTAESVIAHELFHHWFGDLVTAESWANLSLNESFANYSEYLWFEHKYGREKADSHLEEEIYSYKMDDNFTKKLIRKHYNSREDMFDAVSYSKGGAILHMLRDYLGDEAFFKGLNKYLRDNEYGKAEYTQLRLALEDVSGRDLNWFFDQWFLGYGHPILEFLSEYDSNTKKVKISIKQTGDLLFEFPYAIDIVENGKSIRKQVWVAKKTINEFEFDAAKKPDVVIPNANQVLLSDLTEIGKTTEEYIEQYKAGEGSFITRKLALEELAKVQITDDKALNLLVKALQDTNDELRSLVIDELEINEPKVIKKTLHILNKIAIDDPSTIVRADAIKALNITENYSDKALNNALKSKSFKLQAVAIEGLIEKYPSKFDYYTKDLDVDIINSSEDLLLSLIPKWIENNDLSKAVYVIEPSSTYLFVKSQDSDRGKELENAFKWVMSNDTEEATKKAIKVFNRYYNYFSQKNKYAAQAITIMAKRGLSLKRMAYLNSKPSNENIKNQIDMLEKAIEGMKL